MNQFLGWCCSIRPRFIAILRGSETLITIVLANQIHERYVIKGASLIWKLQIDKRHCVTMGRWSCIINLLWL